MATQTLKKATQKLPLARCVVIALSTPSVSKNSLREEGCRNRPPMRHSRKSETPINMHKA